LNDVVETARGWIGTPYHHQGRAKGHGVDCVGLILGVAHELAIPLIDKPEFRQVGRRPPRGDWMLACFDEQCDRVEEPEPGDVLVFWWNPRSKRPHHLALFTGENLIHTHSLVGRIVEQPFNEWWQERFVAAYRMRR
jgi:NlpC/P60 family putative phage cell wall peptidase